ncbi:hypothetical protein GCM10009122_58770 [Fulvivirga kasyanovii]|uniref:Lipocalin-like domain-containing protein n=1 Tax=Fulvivirga kasyanovii TaxID=396812 RepID=A0ABW9RW89_9BACT|nr:hypothetical protein [Fulvivirga kasyanovii]MTI27971.1 hypothetical protein [Fulvivirga kasyanovii]
MKTFFAHIIIILCCVPSFAQDITGLWKVSKVEVAGKVMTPVAKWTNIKEDGTYESGNGWLQNSLGTWAYDEASRQFATSENIGIRDEYDAFEVSFEGAAMIWKRKEDGMDVVVTLENITDLPMSTADQLHGLWDLQDIISGGNSITSTFDKDNRYYLFMRWDRIYVKRNSKGEKLSGYWHIDGHRPEITLLSHQPDTTPESWQVEVDDDKLKLTGISDSNKGLIMTFKKLHTFPD